MGAVTDIWDAIILAWGAITDTWGANTHIGYQYTHGVPIPGTNTHIGYRTITDTVPLQTHGVPSPCFSIIGASKTHTLPGTCRIKSLKLRLERSKILT